MSDYPSDNHAHSQSSGYGHDHYPSSQRDFDGHHHGHATDSSGYGLGAAASASASAAAARQHLQTLRAAWLHELAAPELLPYEAAAVAYTTAAIERTQTRLDDASLTELPEPVDELRDLDLQRTIYVLKAYLRARLGKIQAHIFFLMGTPETPPAMFDRLSGPERAFAQRFFDEVVMRRLTRTVLGEMPKRFATLEEVDDAPNMQRTLEFLSAFFYRYLY